MKFKIITAVIFFTLFGYLFPSFAQTPTVQVSPTPIPTSTPVPTAATPAAPQGVKATAIDSERIDVTWQAVNGASAYEVYRNDELVALVGALIYSDTDLRAATSYNYKIRSFNGTNYSGFSTVVSATTLEEVNVEVPEATLSPEQANETTPPVEENFSFVTVGDTTYAYDEIQEFEAGESFVVYGRTVNFADVEVSVNSQANPYFAKADDDGFWEVAIDTTDFEPGEYTFRITITAEDFPESYTSDEYPFQILETEIVEEEQVDNSFGANLSRNITIIIILLVIILIVAGFVAYKKGLLNKLLGREEKDKKPDTPTDGSDSTASSLDNMIQIDTETTPTTENTEVIADEDIPTEMRMDTNDFSEHMEPQTTASDSTDSLDIADDTVGAEISEEMIQADDPQKVEQVRTEINEPQPGAAATDTVDSIEQIDNSSISDAGTNEVVNYSQNEASEMIASGDNEPPGNQNVISATLEENVPQTLPEVNTTTPDSATADNLANPTQPVETKGPELN